MRSDVATSGPITLSHISMCEKSSAVGLSHLRVSVLNPPITVRFVGIEGGSISPVMVFSAITVDEFPFEYIAVTLTITLSPIEYPGILYATAVPFNNTTVSLCISLIESGSSAPAGLSHLAKSTG